MAASDFVISAKQKIREGSVGNNRPNSEAVNQEISGSLNALIDSDFYTIDTQYSGYFSNSRLFKAAPYRIEKDSDLIWYQMSLEDCGNSGSNVFNVAIYDDTGAFVNNLFGSGANRCLISNNNADRCLITRDIDNGTTDSTNATGTVQFGNTNLTTFQAGYILVPFVESFATAARSIRFTMKIREQ